MAGVDGAAPGSPGSRTAASLVAACVLVSLIFGFAGLLSFARDSLAAQVAPNVSVYLVVMVGLTLAVWLLSWAYVTRAGAAERRRHGGTPT